MPFVNPTNRDLAICKIDWMKQIAIFMLRDMNIIVRCRWSDMKKRQCIPLNDKLWRQNKTKKQNSQSIECIVNYWIDLINVTRWESLGYNLQCLNHNLTEHIVFAVVNWPLRIRYLHQSVAYFRINATIKSNTVEESRNMDCGSVFDIPSSTTEVDVLWSR